MVTDGCDGATNSGERSRSFRAGRAKNWDKHVDHVEALAHTPAFAALREQILELAMLRPQEHVLDVGAGTGPLAFAAASRVEHVTALEVSAPMCRRLESHRERLGIGNVDTVVASATEMPIADGSIDVVLSNYCFHHMSDADKHRALGEVHRVLRPDGRLVISDMMFRVGVADPRDRAVVLLLTKRMLRKGLPGVARLVKNALRRLTGRWEHPASIDWWREALPAAGFAGVQLRALEHEGGIAVAHRADGDS